MRRLRRRCTRGAHAAGPRHRRRCCADASRPVVLAVNKAEGMAPRTRRRRVPRARPRRAASPISAAHGDDVREPDRARARAAVPQIAETDAESTRRERPHQGRGRRPAQRRQVDARQHAARRGARDRVRPAGHDARLDLSRLRARRAPLHADRHRRRAPARQGASKRSRSSRWSRRCRRSRTPTSSMLLLDAQHDITEQDAHIAGYILEAGRALVVARQQVGRGRHGASANASSAISQRKLGFLDFADAALHLGARGPRRRRAACARSTRPTPRRWRSCRRRGSRASLQLAVERQQPPRAGAVRPKLRYAHQGGMNPPLIVIHGNALAARPRRLPALPGTFLPRRVPTARHAA